MHTPSQIHQRLHNRRFTVANNAHGLSGAGTVFHTSSRAMPFPVLTKAGASALVSRPDA